MNKAYHLLLAVFILVSFVHADKNVPKNDAESSLHNFIAEHLILSASFLGCAITTAYSALLWGKGYGISKKTMNLQKNFEGQCQSHWYENLSKKLKNLIKETPQNATTRIPELQRYLELNPEALGTFAGLIIETPFHYRTQALPEANLREKDVALRSYPIGPLGELLKKTSL